MKRDQRAKGKFPAGPNLLHSIYKPRERTSSPPHPLYRVSQFIFSNVF